jgi:hypothetical protein
MRTEHTSRGDGSQQFCSSARTERATALRIQLRAARRRARARWGTLEWHEAARVSNLIASALWTELTDDELLKEFERETGNEIPRDLRDDWIAGIREVNYLPLKLRKHLARGPQRRSGGTYVEVLTRWEKVIGRGWLWRALRTDTARVGKRSDLIWKMINGLLELGVDADDIVVLVMRSPWNVDKFNERRMRQQVDKAINRKFSR